MTLTLADLQPQPLWRHFAAISAIPRASAKEQAARAYVLGQASALGLEAIQDAVGNVVVRKPARPGREGAPMAALQGHLDMVCEKNEGTAHNFDTDPIQVVIDGDWVKAAGTTLGADNGVGVAAALAVMESTDVAHGPLEFVFTIDEESGLTGASEFPTGLLRSKYFLNLDGEEEGALCIGCAGGLNTVARRAVQFQSVPPGDALRVRISGLQGGHSGLDINKGRGNAVRILGQVMQVLLDRVPMAIASLQGGSKRNAIPREASAIVVVDPVRIPELNAVLDEWQAALRADLGSFDPGLRITAEPAPRPEQVLSDTDARAVVDTLASQHHGVLAMSPDVPGLVQTSTNLAIVLTRDGTVEIETSQRSPILTSKLAAARMVSTVFAAGGFQTEQTGGYPGWKPEPASEIVRLSKAAHNEILGHVPELMAMHAGLECGVIGEKHDGMEMISFGPHIVDVHSPSERLKISSVEPFYRFLTGLLERL
ncbi:aminoacyl-histidine dipeptidase [uncultured Paludibaculum sp.]|uniref:aminoacyl-histidine dipeptidase n=1 Tax=uncultured Paludibaculum sp. TaxID=1765020 RepID=UPI002AAA68E3|nr:aminoacyl-histidine dipeptidase [uncultured Paludibaculum sp.]